MHNNIFSIPGLEFFVFLEGDAKMRWRGDYCGMQVVNAAPIDNNKKCIILLDVGASKLATFENLLCLDYDGNIVWKAELPQTQDAFVSFFINENEFRANTWSGYRVRLDINTGKLIEKQFAK